MTVYYIEKKLDGTVSIFSGEMSDRHKLWTQRPAAKEISKKEYEALRKYLEESDENKLKYNR